MKEIIILCALPLAMLFAADDKSATQSAPDKSAQDKKPAKAAAPSGLPAGAVQSSPFTWRFTDTQGKKWIYRQTPFGLVKLDDKPEDKEQGPAASEAKNPTTVTDLGESVKFERNTPFGKQSWTKKKTELDDDEQALLKKSQEKE